MDEKITRVLSGGKSPGRYLEVMRLLNHEDHGEYEEQPQRKKRFLGWGCIRKNISVLIIAQKEGFASVCNGYV